MEIQEESKTIKDFLQIARRRKYFIVIPMLLLLLSSVLIALLLPPVYRSEATILIEQQHIPIELVKSTVVSFADERIQQIQQKIMRIDNINKIIKKYSLYSEKIGQLSATELAEFFVKNVSVDVVSADVISQGRQSKATLAFDLSFDHKSAVLAQKVANELVTLFLAENARSRTERAKETSLFLNEEADKYKQKIQEIEDKIAEYKDKYNSSLPELLPVTLASITRVENELQQLKLQEKMLSERKSNLRSQLAMTSPAVMQQGQTKSTQPVSLGGLKAEYRKLLAKYSESHPDVKSIKRKIKNFKSSSSETSQNSPENIYNPIYLQLQSELKMARVEVGGIGARRAKLNESLRQLQENVSKTNQVERGYNDLQRDLKSNREKYRELNAKYMDARLAQTLEEEQKAEKFSILEPPRVPTKPEKPNRIKIIFLGLILSVCGGLGVGYLVEMMDGGIRGQRALTSITGFEPLVVIPYIINDEDLLRTRKNKINFAMIGVSVFVFLLLAVHFLYMPLDLIMYKILYKLEALITS
jgi:polysaccharide chain length determinant protein (PEP-CTERM system associated)